MKSSHEMAENVLSRRNQYIIERRKQMKKLTAVISCFCVCALLAVGFWQGGVFNPIIDDTSISETSSADETQLSEQYLYQVDEGKFSSYIGGKVIKEDKLSGKMTDVRVTAGWKSMPDNKWLTQESLRAEIYGISGISEDIAVALKFIDQGDAITTTHYYVIMNPNADLSAVDDYIIRSTLPNPGVSSPDHKDDGAFGTTIGETSVSAASPAAEIQISES